MEKRSFGNTGLRVSRLTFGCGAVGGLMTKGAAADQDRAIAWARDNGINFFDTAASYGNGTSEVNLGRALNGNTDGIVVSTKVGLSNDDLSDIAGSITRSLDASIQREVWPLADNIATNPIFRLKSAPLTKPECPQFRRTKWAKSDSTSLTASHPKTRFPH